MSLQADLSLAAVIPLLGVIAGGGLGYVFGRLLETRKQLAMQKGLAYADYLRALAHAATHSRSKDTLALAADAKTRVCIYGSRAVIERLGAFERAGARIESRESRIVVAEMVEAMRRDAGVSGGAVMQADLHDILFGPKP